MSSLVLQPSSSLPPSFPYSVHGAAAALPVSPSSSWSPSASPRSRMQSLCLATSAPSPLSAYSFPPSAQPHPAASGSTAVVAHVLSSPAPRMQSMPSANTTAIGSTVSGRATFLHQSPLASTSANAAFYTAAQLPMSPPAAIVNVSANVSSPQQVGSSMAGGMNQTSLPTTSALQSGQTIVFDQNGQAFILSPITSVSPAFQSAKPQNVHLSQYASTHYPPVSVQSLSSGSDWLSSHVGSTEQPTHSGIGQRCFVAVEHYRAEPAATVSTSVEWRRRGATGSRTNHREPTVLRYSASRLESDCSGWLDHTAAILTSTATGTEFRATTAQQWQHTDYAVRLRQSDGISLGRSVTGADRAECVSVAGKALTVGQRVALSDSVVAAIEPCGGIATKQRTASLHCGRQRQSNSAAENVGRFRVVHTQ